MDEFTVGMKKDCSITWMNARIEKMQLIYLDELMEGLIKGSLFTWVNSW